MPGISIRNLKKTFPNGVRAVDDLSLDIKDGSFVSLLGPSGCGKTTTLRIIAGLEHPEEGSIHVGGKAFLDTAKGEFVPAEKRGLGMVFQSYALWPHMTAGANVEFSLKLKGVPQQERSRRVRAVLDLLQIGELEDRYSFQLSGGQQQRVALARMLASDAEVFLLDEPLSNLDAKLRLEMRSELKRIHSRFERTTVFVTHDQLEAMTLSTHIAVMKNGSLQQYGTPHEIYHHPANRFVAEFVGSPPVNIVSAAEPGVFQPFLDAIARHPEKPAADRVHAIGFRPEHVQFRTGEGTTALRNGHVCLEAVVDAVLPTGPETIVQYRIGEQRYFGRVDSETLLRQGESPSVTIPVERLLLFDRHGVALNTPSTE
ncbi:MAG: ABC transporter ATP-binding protein [Spirochaetota bacterium]